MMFKATAIVLGTVWVMGVGTLGVGAQKKTTWDGVYTEDQAKRGSEAYMKDCSSCHQADLAGDGFAPGLSGPEFTSAWNGLSVGDLLERMRVSMPPTEPGSLSVAAKADIIAFLLKSNRFPAGAAELPQDVDSAKLIQYAATKP